MILILTVITSLISAQTECVGISYSTPCYGICQSFIDNNTNGICDIWEKYNEEKNEREDINYKKIKDKKIFRHALPQVIIISIIIIILAEFLNKRIKNIRLILNWILLISTIISSLSGFFLYFSILDSHRQTLYSLHIQSSTIFFIIAIHHTIKRFKCMIKTNF
ncbi:MAG: hypothetical protein N2446_01655 [Elusimicrobiales bacterium]|nr:hypothetical protein [Elusimicrobiales bacterium]